VTPLRILHITPYYEQAWAYGGIPRIVTTLARGLARRGHHVTVCSTDVADAETRLPLATQGRPLADAHAAPAGGDIDVRIFPNLSNKLAYHMQLFLPVGMDGFLRRQSRTFDVAHLHAYRNVPGVLAAQHLERAGVPYVLAPNGTLPRIERRQMAKWVFDQTVGRQVLPRAARLLAVSEAEERQLLEAGAAGEAIRVIPNPVDLDEVPAAAPRGSFRRRQAGAAGEAIRVIPNPVDLDEVPAAAPRGSFRRRFGIPDGALVLYLGKLTPRKGVDVLIHAFAKLERPGAHLCIAGNDMGVEAELRKLVARTGIEARTTFTGLVRGAERFEALADADVVVYASKDEIFGLVPLEALLMGTPVVVADDSGCGEIVGRVGGGVVVRQGDALALAAALERILSEQPRWREAAAQASARVRAEFSGEAVCGRLEELYRDMIARRGSRR
jgi:glycosyltransferase involved in cell wall biosynthesis